VGVPTKGFRTWDVDELWISTVHNALRTYLSSIYGTNEPRGYKSAVRLDQLQPCGLAIAGHRTALVGDGEGSGTLDEP
jgi:hypothetical protein